jgi:DNA-binding winged helix-turn-helix (wHTH) protein
MGLRFGRFELLPTERTLLHAGQPVALGARAFDLLLALIERRTRLVTKAALLDLVWPGLVVEEANLPVQVSGLRKIIGPQVGSRYPDAGTALRWQSRATSPPSAAAPSRLLA